MRIVFLLMLLSGIIPAIAKDKPQISAEPSWLYKTKPDAKKQPDLKEISNGYYLELYDAQINIPKQTSYTHYARKIVNESGIQNGSEISVQFSPEYETLQFHYIRVIRNGVILNRLQLNDIKVIQEENDVDKYQYNGLKRAFVILKDIRKDDRIEAAYSLTGFNPVFTNRFTENIFFVNDNPVLNYYQTIIASPQTQLDFTCFGGSSKPQELSEDEFKIYHWNNPGIALWESTGGSPSWYDSYPSVTVTEFHSWQEVAEWGLSIYNNYRFELPGKLKAKIAEWRKISNGDENEFSRLALRFVQDDIRYLGLEIGVNTHRPHPPAEVFNNGYGDCKDKALLLSAILRDQRIPAYAALVNTSVRGNLINRPSTPYEFDHVIVAIDRPGGLKFVDPTLSYQRGTIPELSTPPYQYALLIKEGEGVLRPIPLLKNATVRSTEWLKVSLADTSSFTVNTTYTAEKAEGIRSYFATTSAKDVSNSYLKYYSSLFDDIVLSKQITHDDDSIRNTMTVAEAYSIANLWTEDDDHKKSFLVYARLIDDILTDPTGKSNKYPLSLDFPNETHYTLKIEMPENWSIDPEKVQIKNDSYEFNFEGTVSGSLITLKYSLVTFKDHIAAEDISKYKKDYKKIADLTQYRFSYGGSSGNGDIQPVNGTNFFAVVLTLLSAGLAFAAFNYFNNMTVDVPYDRSDANRLRGWVAALGVSLFIKGGYLLYNIYLGEYFSAESYAKWQSYGNGFAYSVMTEFFFQVFIFLSTIAIIYWYLKRRDIFPKMFNGYVTVIIASHAILFILYKLNTNHENLSAVTTNSLKQVGRSFLYALIWCTFLSRSENAKWTFLKEYKR